ncbi:MAG: hypothetical protein JJ858_06990 [Rhizobiaceae bacterium]|nr:hypothetical protein [Rhizobiaceae bacterium]
MPNTDNQNVDKNIVDRTQRKPNEAVMNAVKDKREKLQHGNSITKSYAREMIERSGSVFLNSFDLVYKCVLTLIKLPPGLVPAD